MSDLMQEFEKRKKLFTTDAKDIEIDLPEPFENLNIPGRVGDGLLIVT